MPFSAAELKPSGPALWKSLINPYELLPGQEDGRNSDEITTFWKDSWAENALV